MVYVENYMIVQYVRDTFTHSAIDSLYWDYVWNVVLSVMACPIQIKCTSVSVDILSSSKMMALKVARYLRLTVNKL